MRPLYTIQQTKGPNYHKSHINAKSHIFDSAGRVSVFRGFDELIYPFIDLECKLTNQK